ncbi:hypothetical protein LL998_33680 (plasmid) [Burkholderia ambifaria]|uniref:hypothetical protein n=1 Tax=Burkholderia ambifaria TaxID=152480 RepID=UPI001E64CD04|nr:hypothetical protein [Burkholderia ambifaria]UEP39693.1 hypothetical protein LL998_33680 [Burkholderia ambifaria]
MNDLYEKRLEPIAGQSMERRDDARRQPVQQHANLEGLRRALLAPRAIVRDENGWLTHPAFPACDESVRADLFLAAFGIESAFVSMESEVDSDAYERHLESGDFNCRWWTPTTPAGEGWQLLKIYDTEEGPYALFAREKQHVTTQARFGGDARQATARSLQIDMDRPPRAPDGDLSEAAGGHVPAAVIAALDRMRTPLHESRLDGATAEADAHSMKVIREYVLGGRGVASAADGTAALDPMRDPRVTKMATFMFRMISAMRRSSEWKGLATEALSYLTEIGVNKTYRIATRAARAAVDADAPPGSAAGTDRAADGVSNADQS